MNNIMNATDEEREQAREFVSKTYDENRALFDRAYELQKMLGLNGFWKGTHLVQAEIIKALEKEQPFSLAIVEASE